MTATRIALLALVFASPALAADPLPKGAVARLGSPRWRSLVDREHSARFDFTPDGKSIACLSPDRTVVWVDAETGRVTKQVRGPAPFTDFGLTPDGKTLVTADVPKAVPMAALPPGPPDPRGLRAWDVSGAPKQTWFQENETGRLSVDARHAAVAGARGVSLIDMRTGKLLWSKPFEDTDGTVITHALTPDGKSVVAVTGGDRVRPVYAWDVAGGERRKLAELDAPHSEFALSFDGSNVAAFGHEKEVRRWDLRTGKALPPLVGHTEGATAAATFSRDGRLVVSSGIDDTIRWWESATGKELGRIRGNAVAAHMRLSPDGKTLAAVCSGQDVLRRFDLTTKRELPTPDGHAAEVHFLAFTADGKSLITAAEDDAVMVWDPKTGKERRRFPARKFGQFRAVATSPDGRLLANANGLDEDPVRVWDLTTGAAVREIATGKGSVTALAFTPDGKALATVRDAPRADGPALRVWDAVTGKEIWQADAPTLASGGLRFSADGKRLWSAIHFEGPHGFDAATGKPVARTDQAYPVIAVSPDGRMFAARAWAMPGESEIRLIETATGKTRLRFGRAPVADAAGPGPLAFSPDGRTVAVSHGPAVVVWDTGTGKEVRRFEGHERRVRALAFSPDGKLLATGSDDSTVLLWSAAAAP